MLIEIGDVRRGQCDGLIGVFGEADRKLSKSGERDERILGARDWYSE
jgi:hypothetical protein